MDDDASAEANQRRDRSEWTLEPQGVLINDWLPLIEDADSARPRDAATVVRRAVALAIVWLKATRGEERGIQVLIDRLRLRAELSPKEQRFVDDPRPSKDDKVQLSWRCECLGVLFWALSLADELPPPIGRLQRGDLMWMQDEVSREDFITSTRLRSLELLLDEADLIYSYHWAVRDAQLHGKPSPGLDPDVVQERHYVLNWLIGYNGADWDDVTTDT